ncbi:delta-1-pyrroline-5-carboxylate dehydrogenase 12A1, mitochondrial-like [Gossypium australe]|uniref:Delta-1-pyrroline-5-carboxylate dehydrogenase 12A1, mitochondrial-like n=1 Tax=Gossypium australe TaxID=47621 RepID=A0A5B6UGR3_9ROSI|nr:delta-1-pyrroline-5-carboxylate dehydrogenase 12A1, mitochondrial-like [Gossypium australe]
MHRIVLQREIRSRASHKALSWFSSYNLFRYGTKSCGNRVCSSLPFATVEAEGISGSQPAEVQNLVQGKWTRSAAWNTLVDPLNGEPFIKVAEVDGNGIQPFVESLSKCPKHGLHNPFKSPERYLLYGDISAKAAHMLALPKVRFLARSFAVPGNHIGQQSHGYRWPYGPVAIITPFNFPLEIPVSIVMEQMMRLLHYCGLPAEDVDFINSDGKTMNKLLMEVC